jgi:hypothetical protein
LEATPSFTKRLRKGYLEAYLSKNSHPNPSIKNRIEQLNFSHLPPTVSSAKAPLPLPVSNFTIVFGRQEKE